MLPQDGCFTQSRESERNHEVRLEIWLRVLRVSLASHVQPVAMEGDSSHVVYNDNNVLCWLKRDVLCCLHESCSILYQEFTCLMHSQSKMKDEIETSKALQKEVYEILIEMYEEVAKGRMVIPDLSQSNPLSQQSLP